MVKKDGVYSAIFIFLDYVALDFQTLSGSAVRDRSFLYLYKYSKYYKIRPESLQRCSGTDSFLE